MFATIEEMLHEDQNNFIMVLIDEIETLSCRRESSLNGSELMDGMKAVNALLLGLDRIRRYKNVLILCTTNLMSALVGFSSIVTMIVDLY